MMILKTTTRKLSLITLLVFSISWPAVASLQENQDAKAKQLPHVFQFLKMNNAWIGTSNPAGLSFAEMHDLGNSYFFYNIHEGDYFRPQEAEGINQFGFTTERYQALGDMHFKGAFTFHNTNETNRGWGNMMEPYRGNPYIFGDTEGGDWEKQYYYLNAAASSGLLFNLFHMGIEAHYEVNTGARQNDPRPLNNTNNIRIRPGLIFPLGNQFLIGVTGYYQNRNESLSMNVVNQNLQHRIYKFRGLGEYRSQFMTGATRTYNASAYGGGMQLQYLMNQGNMLLLDVTYKSHQEDATDGSSTVEHGGEYVATVIDATLGFQANGNNYKHLADAYVNMTEHKGIEHSQQFDIYQDRWVTFATTVRYLGDEYNAGANYYFVRTRNMSDDYNWMAGLHMGYVLNDLRFLLPNSTQTNSAVHAGVSGKKNVVISKNILHLGVNAGYKLSLDEQMSISPHLANEDRMILIDNVFNPDFNYLIQDYATIGLDLAYNFSIAGMTGNNYYIGINATRYHLMENDSAESLYTDGRNFITFRLGMVY